MSNEQLYSELIEAVLNRPTLERLVRFRMGVSLNEITIGGNLREDVFRLIEWAQSRNRLSDIEDVIATAREESTLANLKPSADGLEREGSRSLLIVYARGNDDDEFFADWLYERLSKNHHDVLIDKGSRISARWSDEIDQNLSRADFLIVLLSANSINSEMIRGEVQQASNLFRQSGRPIILPIRIKFPHSNYLGYELSRYLDGMNDVLWNGYEDSESILQYVVAVADGDMTTEEKNRQLESGKPMRVNTQQPQPTADLTDLMVPGGAMQPTDSYYVARPADAEIQRMAARDGETVVIKGPRQIGKSSLLRRYLLACHKRRKKIALMDLSMFADDQLAEYSKFLTELAVAISKRLSIPGSAPTQIDSQSAMIDWVEYSLLTTLRDNLVLAFDEADRILGRPYQSDFFTMLRHWHDRRSDIPETAWTRLDLAMVISSEPYLLISDGDRSPFNVSVPIQLDPLNEAECRTLNRIHRSHLSDDEVDELRELLGGHPFLTQLAHYRLANSGATFSELHETAHIEDGPFGDHLRALLRILSKLENSNLLAVMCDVVKHGAVPDTDSYYRLRAAGLVRKEAGRILPTSLLYARFFGMVS